MDAGQRNKLEDVFGSRCWAWQSSGCLISFQVPYLFAKQYSNNYTCILNWTVFCVHYSSMTLIILGLSLSWHHDKEHFLFLLFICLFVKDSHLSPLYSVMFKSQLFEKEVRFNVGQHVGKLSLYCCSFMLLKCFYFIN